MRTEKRFTPKLLERYEREGRGTGTFEVYIPWHRVSRGDPSSLGRSHLTIWHGRQREFLSDIERDGAHFSMMLPNILDLREQFKLSLHAGPNELAAYDLRFAGQHLPGTLDIAAQLKFKHPQVHGDGRTSSWVMTTDQLLLLTAPDGRHELLALSFKPSREKLTKRSLELLAIEREYWAARSVSWLLITTELFEKSVALTLRRTAPWALGKAVESSAISVAVDIVESTLGHSFTYTLNALTDQLRNVDLAQRTFWQAVWAGAIPLDLRRGWRPHLPIGLLSQEQFTALNPVASRRSAWN